MDIPRPPDGNVYYFWRRIIDTFTTGHTTERFTDISLTNQLADSQLADKTTR